MARPRKTVPALVHHKPTNRARVRIDGRDVWCGRWDHGAKEPSPEALEKYRRVIAAYLSNGDATDEADRSAEPSALSVAKVLKRYWRFAQSHYVKAGQPTSQIACVRSALGAVNRLYGGTRATGFGPRKLKLVRDEIVRQGRSRKTVNDYVACIKRAFRWAVSEELVPPSVYEGLRAISGLQKGRSDARETDPIKPVDDETVNATLPYLPQAVAAMVRLQLLTGMRPGEVCGMRPCDVNRDGEVWEFIPSSHKTEHHERERRIYVGPRAQEVLAPFMLRTHDAYCFCPADSEARRNAERRTRSQVRKLKTDRTRPPGDRYTKDSYRRAVARACEIAFGMPRELRNIKSAVRRLPEDQRQTERLRLRWAAAEWRRKHCWAPNQLRHSGATVIRKHYGREAAQVVLGHSDPRVTEIYAERDFALARRVMAEVG